MPQTTSSGCPRLRTGFRFLAAAVATSAALTAQAGFVDERRKPAAPPPIAVEQGAVKGEVVGDWDSEAPEATDSTSVASAIARLLPPSLPGVVIEAPGVEMTANVSWPEGLTRRQALDYVSKNYGLNFEFDGPRIKVSKTPKVSATGEVVAYAISPADVHFRGAIKRWAAAAGWTFGDQYWKLPVDVPVVGTAALGSDFKAAVRKLMDSTELISAPGRPCFYSNKVLRIVPAAQQCDRAKDSTAP